MSNNAYILFYQQRGIDFDNIINYEKIKNALRECESGQEKFNPDEIEFPQIPLTNLKQSLIKPPTKCEKNLG